MNDGQGFQKRRHLLDLLDDGLVMVHIDPRGDDVIVPQHFKADPVLRLNLAYQFRLPALNIGAEGVYAVLSFNKQNFGCTLPWSCIFAVTRPDANHDGMVWPESAPAELRASLAGSGVTSATPLAVVPEADDVTPEAPALTSDADAAQSESEPPLRRRGHLALVKG